MSHSRQKIGYIALHLPDGVLCEGDACIVAGVPSDLHRYARAQAGFPSSPSLKKVFFEEILLGLAQGGEYVLDRRAYRRFYPLAQAMGNDLPLVSL
jgi:hypothetical protein